MKPRCIIAGCEKKSAARGLCRSCYQRAYMRIVAKTVTWEQLIGLGLATGAPPREKYERSPFAVALKKAMEAPDAAQVVAGDAQG